MPATRSFALIDALLRAASESNGAAVCTLAGNRGNPKTLVVDWQGETLDVWVYVWTLTRGGRGNLPNEYRIQMTGVPSPLPLNPKGFTMLMGYYEDLDLFAGFDISLHRSFTPGSPSVQISLDALHDAVQHGLGFARKENGEIAIGVRKDQFLNYVCNASLLHSASQSAGAYALLVEASQAGEVDTADLKRLGTERRRVLAEVSRLSRDARFRQQVLSAYENRCAVTRHQMRVVEAAHILPVGAPGSVDAVGNGIALSPTLHRAFDQALVYLDLHFRLCLNPEREAHLVSIAQSDGLTYIRGFCGRRVHLPHDTRQWPDLAIVETANRYRRIPGYN